MNGGMNARSGAWLRWGGSFVAVLAVHAGAFLALHRPPSPAPGKSTTAPIMIDLAPVASAPPAAAAPPLQPPPLQPPPLPQPPDPPPIPAIQHLPKAAVVLPPRHPVVHVRPPHPVLPRPAVRMPELPQAAIRTPALAAPVPAARPGPSSAPPVGETLADWQSALLTHLARYKRFPPEAQEEGEQGVVLMRVTLSHDGRVLAMSLVRSSGFADLDAEAPAWIQRASPLPAFPSSITAQQINLVIPLRFSLQ